MFNGLRTRLSGRAFFVDETTAKNDAGSIYSALTKSAQSITKLVRQSTVISIELEQVAEPTVSAKSKQCLTTFLGKSHVTLVEVDLDDRNLFAVNILTVRTVRIKLTS